MTHLFAADLKLFCISVIMIGLLTLGVLVSLLHLDVIRSDWALTGYEAGRRYGTRRLLSMHHSLFKRSWKRRLLYISFGIFLAALIPYAVLYANDLVNNKLFHLISRAR